MIEAQIYTLVIHYSHKYTTLMKYKENVAKIRFTIQFIWVFK